LYRRQAEALAAQQAEAQKRAAVEMTYALARENTQSNCARKAGKGSSSE